MKREAVEKLLTSHFRLRPLMRATDFYKLIYQGVFGVSHIITEGAWGWLEKEAEGLNLQEHPEEPLLEEVSADGEMVRVNLRPYMRQGLPLGGLFAALKETSRVEGSSEEFKEAWVVFKALMASGRLKVNSGEFEALDDELRREGCRPHHHSEAYQATYHPAYRVVTRESLAGILDQRKY